MLHQSPCPIRRLPNGRSLLLALGLMLALTQSAHAQAVRAMLFFVPPEILSTEPILGELNGFGHSVYENGLGARVAVTTSLRNPVFVGGGFEYMLFTSEDYGNQRLTEGHYALLSPQVGVNLRIIRVVGALDFGVESLGALTRYNRIITPDGRYRMVEEVTARRNNVAYGGHITAGFAVPFQENKYSLDFEFSANYLRSEASENLFWTVGLGMTVNLDDAPSD